MTLIRLALISFMAAFAGCAAGSILIFGELGRASFVALPFTCMGAILLLAPIYAAAREDGVSVGIRYARVLVAGALAGGLMLGLISALTDPLRGAAIGAGYGVLTALCWIAIHAATKRVSGFLG